MTETVLLIDGDQYVHRCCAATERDIKWDEENHVLASNEEEAWDTLAGAVRELTDHFNTKQVVFCMTDYDAPLFRLGVDPTYKTNRKDSRKPLCYWDIRQRAGVEWKAVSFPGLEADDVMGILATKPGPTHRIIISRDKDMRTIPAPIWTGKDFYNVTEEEADYFHLYQTLVGDAADGYRGCPGIGPKKAAFALCELNPASEAFNPKRPPDIGWTVVKILYEKAGLTADDALRQARLARILRWDDWDTKNKKVKLWEPK